MKEEAVYCMMAEHIREWINPPEAWLKCDKKTRIRYFIRKIVGNLLCLPFLILAVPFIVTGTVLRLIGARILWIADWLSMNSTERHDGPKQDNPAPEAA